MIFDDLVNIKNYKGLNKNLDKAIDFVLNTNLNALLDTPKQVIDNDVYYFLNTYYCKEEKELLYEIHKNHFDIQIILSGNEDMKVFPSDEKLEAFDNYDPNKDFQYFKQKEGAATFKAHVNSFAIFFPNEYHMPSIKVDDNKLRKLVLKINK